MPCKEFSRTAGSQIQSLGTAGSPASFTDFSG